MKTLSYSSVNLLLSCPRAWEYKYVKRIRGPAKAALYVGSLTERAIDFHNHERVAGRRGLSLPDVADYIHAKATEVYESQEYNFPKEDLGPHVEESQSLAFKYIADLAPKYVPIAVQERFIFPIPDTSYGVTGIMDAVAEGNIVVESKTSAPGWWTLARAAKALQPTFYAMARHFETGKVPLVRYHIVEKRNGRTLTLDATRGEHELVWLLNALTQAVRFLDAGNFIPAHPDSPACRAGWCDAWTFCKEGAPLPGEPNG